MIITGSLTNSELLWSKVSWLLQEDPASDDRSHSADDFEAFFHGKIEKIRQSTLNAPEAVIEWRRIRQLPRSSSSFQRITASWIRHQLG